jgi:ubiquinone/menaquinone biosynthesis C-methylase UbiE
MTDNLEHNVSRHYGAGNLQERLLKAIAAAGLDVANLVPRDLAQMDEFHIGGRVATEYLVAKLGLKRAMHVLDVGCGIGGTARYIASEIGSRVTGIDLTPQYIEVAHDLTERTGLTGRVTYTTASALKMPFPDESFDAAVTLHVAMNIRDRDRLYREIARVLKPGANLGLYDVMKGPRDGMRFPVPWAETAETSYLTTPAETAKHLERAGFVIEETEDRRNFGINFMRERLAAGSSGANALGLHLVMGETAPMKYRNMLHNLEGDHILPVLMRARRAG